jgi:hypothetical protein
MAVDVLDRILQSDDMGIPVMVDFIYDASQCGGFTTACRAGNKYKALRFLV